MDPLSMNIGPYGMIGSMDPSLYPVLQGYRSALAQYEQAAGGSTMTAPQTRTGTSTGTEGGNNTGYRRIPQYGTPEYWDYQRENQSRMMDNTIERGKQWQIKNYAINGPMSKVYKAAEALHTKILENEQDQIMVAFQAYKNTIKEAIYPNEEEVDDDLLTAQAKSIYENKYGVTLDDDLRANSTPAFWNGFISSTTFGLFGDDRMAAENIAEIDDLPVSSKQKMWKRTGEIVGPTATYAGIGAAIGSIVPGIGTAAGAIAGGVIGLIKGIFT